MDLKKVNCEVGGLVNDNLRKLESIFPSAVKDGEVDFDELKELLGDFKEVDKEKYEINWVGKKEAKKIALTPLYCKTLKYIEGDGKNECSTENLYIEGDNLEALKLLQSSYYGKIKMIYIDPPYNTGNDFVYNDKFKYDKVEIEIQEGDRNNYGERFVKNQNSCSNYHSKWMNMIYSRLIISKNLLTDDGVIFISIDDNEVANLKKICDEIFGEENFNGTFVVNSTPNARDYGHIGKMHEYVLFYSKDIVHTNTNLLPNEKKEFKYSDNKGGFNIHPLYNSNVSFTNLNRPNLYYPFYIDINTVLENGFYSISLEKKDGFIEIYPPKSQKDDIQFVWRWGKEKSKYELNKEIVGYKTDQGEFRIVQKMRNTEKIIRSLQLDKSFSSRRGTAEVENIFNKKIFSFPKPIALITDFIKAGMNENDLILDFFSGSATTAHAVMQLNAEDNGSRKYIMVQLPELTDEKSEAYKLGYKNICEIGKERIRRAGDKILKENKDKEGIENLDIGFKVFRVENSNIKWENQLEEDGQIRYDLDGKNIDDVDFVPGTTDIDVVYEILLRHYGIPLTAKIEKLDFIGNRTYAIQDSIIVCLETQITKDIVDKVSELDPIKVIFRDSAFGDDISLKQNSVHRLNLLIEKKNKNTTHVVEFI